MPRFLPIFLDLRQKPVLLVGGGLVAEEKLIKLLAASAKVQVIAKEIGPEVRKLIDDNGLTVEQRSFEDDDVDGFFVVISAVNDPETHTRISDRARAKGILVNTVDAPESSDFYFAAQIDRGSLQIAIATQGLFPGVARSIRLWLEELLPDDITPEFDDLVKLRQSIKGRIPDAKKRMIALKEQLALWNNNTQSQYLEQ